jgi:hypothetical protein
MYRLSQHHTLLLISWKFGELKEEVMAEKVDMLSVGKI